MGRETHILLEVSNVEEFISTNEVALLLGKSAATLGKYIRDKIFPEPTHYRGARRFWLAADVADALERLRRPRPLADRKSILPASCESR